MLKAARDQEFEDDRTQIMFYKKPSLRTDVFGLGALLFDLLTVGRSPEGFYDHLRPFDRSGDTGVSSVEVLVDRYRAAASATSTSADMAPLFDQIRDHVHGRFPSDGIIAVLFRCMLSRKRDSYYGQACRKRRIGRSDEAVHQDSGGSRSLGDRQQSPRKTWFQSDLGR